MIRGIVTKEYCTWRHQFNWFQRTSFWSSMLVFRGVSFRTFNHIWQPHWHLPIHPPFRPVSTISLFFSCGAAKSHNALPPHHDFFRYRISTTFSRSLKAPLAAGGFFLLLGDFFFYHARHELNIRWDFLCNGFFCFTFNRIWFWKSQLRSHTGWQPLTKIHETTKTKQYFTGFLNNRSCVKFYKIIPAKKHMKRDFLRSCIPALHKNTSWLPPFQVRVFHHITSPQSLSSPGVWYRKNCTT